MIEFDVEDINQIDFSRPGDYVDERPSQALIDTEQAKRMALENLTSQQHEAVTYPARPLLILAGAGTGKTKCLTSRISYRIATGQTLPANVLAVTFTKKAAQEMRKRLQTMIGITAKGMDIGTFHSVCSKILRDNVEHTRLQPKFTTLDERDQNAIVKEINENIIYESVKERLSKSSLDYEYANAIHSVNEQNSRRKTRNEILRNVQTVLLKDVYDDNSPDNQKKIAAELKETKAKYAVDIANAISKHSSKKPNLENEQYLLLEDLISLIDNYEYDSNEILTEIEQWKSQYALSENVWDAPSPSTIVERYCERLKETNCADYTDLMCEVIIMFRDYENVRDYYRTVWRSIYIDEYQDTNDVQEYLIRQLCPIEEVCDITVVGDDDQSIYSWRGADIQNILDFDKHRPDTKIVKLEQNFRSFQNILDHANHIIEKNGDRHGKKLFSDKDEDLAVQIRGGANAYATEYDENQAIVARIEHLIKEGVPTEEIAVICRSAVPINRLQSPMIIKKIPYTFTAGRKFTDSAHIKTIIAYMRMLKNANDDEAFKMAFNSRPRAFGKASQDKILKSSISLNISMKDMLHIQLQNGTVKGKAAKGVLEFFETMDRLNFLMKVIEDDCMILKDPDIADFTPDEVKNLKVQLQKNVNSLVSRIIDDMQVDEEFSIAEEKMNSEMDSYRQKEMKRQLSSDKEKIEEFFRLVSDVNDFDDFLDSVNLTDISHKESAEGVWIGTIHAAKGLEFKHVFLPGWDVGTFPSLKAENMEEERRLAYVALTRAKEHLYVSSVKETRTHLQNAQNANNGKNDSEFMLDLLEVTN
jgi:superfamily I DNA/RNA helicase